MERALYGLRVCTAALVVCVVPSSVAAQQLSLSHKQSSTALPELSGATGFDLLLSFPAGPARLGAGIHHLSRETQLDTRVCVSYEQRVGCLTEPTRREARLSGLAVTAGLPLQLLPQLVVEGGTGITLSQVRAQDRTQSGRPNALYSNPTGQWGVLLNVTARLKPLATLPLSLHAGAGQHLLRLTSCGEYEWDDAPFCGNSSVREIRIGASLDFR
jgi:hypothetical protein